MFVDISMPGMDGIEVARRGNELRPDLPVLFATGYGHSVPRWREDMDRNSMIRKPYRTKELLRKTQASLRSGR